MAAENEAFEQIEAKEYAAEMQDRGVQRIAYIALIFAGKALHPQFRPTLDPPERRFLFIDPPCFFTDHPVD